MDAFLRQRATGSAAETESNQQARQTGTEHAAQRSQRQIGQLKAQAQAAQRENRRSGCATPGIMRPFTMLPTVRLTSNGVTTRT